ncbi:RidA family protein [Candidatus Poribacteria bacterium]|nr:RidA family protein [Candidatus Poribacteria bacterium]
MNKQIVLTEKAPKPVGPYSQAIKAGGWIYLSGQIPIDPATNQLVLGTIEEQTELVLTNSKRVLEAAGATLRHVVKVSLFIANMDDFPKINGVYSRFFPSEPPARSTVQVARLPKEVGIEVEMVAFNPEP